MQSDAPDVPSYLAALPEDRRSVMAWLCDFIRTRIDAGFQEQMQYGMIAWNVPHSRYPGGYHCDPKQPLPFLALAAQKQYYAIYLMGLYMGAGANGETDLSEALRQAYQKAGKRLDLGKSCLRFRSLDELLPDALDRALRALDVDQYIARYEASLSPSALAKLRRAAKARTG